MANKNQKKQFGKPQAKPKNGFEQLVEAKEKAKQKKVMKAATLVQAPQEVSGSLKRVVDSSDINKTLLRKRNKKSLFDLESDDENITSNFFVKEVDNLLDLATDEQPKQKLAKGVKSDKDAFQDVIRNSKQKRYEKTKTKEEMNEEIKMLDKKFTGIQEKLQLGDPTEIRQSKFDTDADYFKMVDSFKGAELLKPVINKPQTEKKHQKTVESDGEEPDIGLEDNDDNESSDYDAGNPEIEDYEEKEVDRRLKRMNLLNAEKKLKSFNKALDGLKANTKNLDEEESEEVEFDSDEDDDEDDSGDLDGSIEDDDAESDESQNDDEDDEESDDDDEEVEDEEEDEEESEEEAPRKTNGKGYPNKKIKR
jgi:hypothetical protein